MEKIFTLYKELLNKTLEMNSLQLAEEILLANNHFFEAKITNKKKIQLYKRIQEIQIEIENISKIDKLLVKNTPWIDEIGFEETFWSIDFTLLEKIRLKISNLKSQINKSPEVLQEIEFLNYFIS
jgi:hypothetical protein